MCLRHDATQTPMPMVELSYSDQPEQASPHWIATPQTSRHSLLVDLVFSGSPLACLVWTSDPIYSSAPGSSCLCSTKLATIERTPSFQRGEMG